MVRRLRLPSLCTALFAIAGALSLTWPSAALARSVLGGGVATLGTEAEETGALHEAFEAVLREASGGEYVQATEECAADPACHCAAARKAGREVAAFGTVARMGELCTLELALVGAQACAVENSIFVTERIPEGASAARLAALARALFVPKAEVSQTAAKSERELDRVPALVTVITAAQIREWGVTTPAQLARFVPGFEALDASWGDRVLQYGLPSTILVMVDGIPRNDPLGAFSFFRYDFDIDLQQVDRVEFVRGPGSVLWGSNAFLGIINFITRTPSRTAPGVTVTGRYGTLANYEAHGEVEQAGRLLSYAFGATFRSREGQPTAVADSILGERDDGSYLWGNSGVTRPRPSRYFDLVGRVRVAGFEFLADYIDTEYFWQVSPSGALLNQDAQGRFQNAYGFFRLSWEGALPAGFGARVALSRFQVVNNEDYAYYPADPRGFPDGVKYVQGSGPNPRASNLVEARLTHEWAGSRVRNRALLGLSLELQQLPDTLASQVGAYEQPRALEVDFAAHDFTTLSAYLQDEVSTDHWSLSAGVRYEERLDLSPVFKMQAALTYVAERLRAKAVYAEGYRNPDANSLYSTVGNQGNPTLRPESSRAMSVEATFVPRAELSVTAGGTWARLSDLVVNDPAAADEGYDVKPVNSSAELDVFAAYAQARLALASRFELLLNYTYKTQSLKQDPRETPFRGFAVAPHTASLVAVGRPVDDFSCFLNLTFLSQRPILLEGPGGVARRTIGATWTSAVGFSLRKLYFESLSLDVTLENPLDVRHATPDTVRDYPVLLLEPRSGRELLVTLRWSPQ